MNKTGIIYATNKDYLTITLASILSLIKNSKNDSLRIYLLTENLSKEDYDIIEKISKKYPTVKLSTHPIEEYHLEQYKIPGWQNTQAANARLFFQTILDEQLQGIEEVLYLDSDTVVVDDLKSLSEYDGKIHAAEDNAMPSHWQQLGLKQYFNSGVLKINVDWWKREKCQERIIKFVKENPTRKLIYPDQDILNYVLGEEIEELPINYNLPPSLNAINNLTLTLYCRKLNKDITVVKEAVENPKILHSYGLLGIKPWTDNHINPYNEMFREYIYQVNPNFQIQPLEKMKQLLSSNLLLFNSLFLLKVYMPENWQDLAKQTTLCLYKKKESGKNNR